MPSFQYDWLEFQGRPLEDRFPDGSVGHPQWVDLVKKVLGNPNDSEACHQAFDDFMAVLAPGEPVLPPQKDCRVFVSHRRGPPDENHAEQIAWHATEHKYDYWLDVHDPILKRLDGSQVPSPAYEVLVAGVIEIALLNCIHIIAVITQNTAPLKVDTI
jgi:hypothetical protein